MQKLSSDELQASLQTLDGWESDGASIRKKFNFRDFNAAMAFINKLAEAANKLNHHPDWSNSYNIVEITLTSHEAGGLTPADIALARAADNAVRELNS